VKLRDLATQWKRLGTELGYKDLELMKIEQSVPYNHKFMQKDLRFLQVLNSWVTGDPEKYKAAVLVKALEAIGYQGYILAGELILLQWVNLKHHTLTAALDIRDQYNRDGPTSNPIRKW
jgi:hypothetical protein